MIEQTATVLSSDDSHAVVEVGRQSSCSSCSAKGCGTGTLANLFGNKAIQLQIDNPLHAQAGDEVVIGIREQALIKGSLLVYILPLLSMMLGGLVGGTVVDTANEAPTLIGAVAGLAIGLLWLRHLTRNLRYNAEFSAVMLRRVTPAQELFHPVNFIPPKS